MNIENRIVKYVQTFPPAISGSGGQKVLWDCTLKLIVGFNLTAEQAAGFLLHYWNDRCDPPWSEKEILRACENAYKNGPAERGTLINPGENLQAVKAPALSLVGPESAPAAPASVPSLVCSESGPSSQTSKNKPVRRIHLIQTEAGPAYKLTLEWSSGSKWYSSFNRRFPDCYINENPTWNEVKREWLFEYAAPDGSPFMLWLRMDKYGVPPKSFLPFHYVPNSDGTGGEFVEGKDPGGKVFPFGVVRFQYFENLIFTEGEKAAARVNAYLAEKRFLNTTATCLPNGAKSWRDDLKEYFRGKNVFVWPDNDETGIQYAVDVCGSLEGVARSVWTLKEYPPGFGSGDDAVEVFQYFANQKGKDDDKNNTK